MLGGITVKEFRNFRGHVLTIISIVLILNLLFNLSNETFEKNRIDYDAKPLLTMDELRAPVDGLEMIVDKDMWPMPSYGDLIFEV